MAKLTWTVQYSANVEQEILDAAKILFKDGQLAKGCKLLMTDAGLDLHGANCIRKLLMQGTTEFDFAYTSNGHKTMTGPY